MDYDCRPKNKRVSNQNKYRRRLRRLSRALNEYVQVATAKLDRSKSGNIRNRAKIEQLLSKSKELAGILTGQEELTYGPRVGDSLVEVPKQTAGDAEEILIGGDEFFKGLRKEEWEEMRRAFKKRD